MAVDELQDQVSYWGTRVAVAEQSVGSAATKRDDRAKEITRLDARRVELASRLQEAENSLNNLDNEKARLRENESGLHGQIEEMRVLIEPAEKDLRGPFSMADIKTQYFNELMVDRFFDVFANIPNITKNHPAIQNLYNLGKIAA